MNGALRSSCDAELANILLLGLVEKPFDCLSTVITLEILDFYTFFQKS